MNIIIDGKEFSQGRRGRQAGPLDAEVLRLSKVAKGLAVNSEKVNNGATVYRNSEGKAKAFDKYTTAYNVIASARKHFPEVAFLCPHVVKASDTTFYVYVHDGDIATV